MPNQSQSRRTLPERIAILLYPGVEPMDYAGPCGIFDLWRLECGGPEIITVAPTKPDMRCAYGRPLLAQYGFGDCPKFDTLLAPGGKGRKAAARHNEILNFMRSRAEDLRFVMSVCTGAFVLDAVGLIDGKRVTTHWEAYDELQAQTAGRGVELVRDVLFVQSGDVWTAGGIYAGVDMALDFVSQFSDVATIERIAVYARRPAHI